VNLTEIPREITVFLSVSKHMMQKIRHVASCIKKKQVYLKLVLADSAVCMSDEELVYCRTCLDLALANVSHAIQVVVNQKKETCTS
jgi:hypothetical protein